MVEMELEGMEDINKLIEKIKKAIVVQSREGLERATSYTAHFIRSNYTGFPMQGFKDRTGALRRSIKGGLADGMQSETEAVGFVGAGDDNIGSEGQPTKNYVGYVEFGNFSQAGDTSFLMPGILVAKPHILGLITDSIDLEKLV